MIDLRIYRAAFLPAVLAGLLAMFSFEGRPPALPQALPADVLFDGTLAGQGLRAIVREHPDRRRGTPGDAAVGEAVASAFARAGFATKVERFTAEGEQLVNVVGRRAGASRRQIAVLAARDARGVPDATGSAADTAALLELARVLEGRASRKTLVLASVDGSTLGDAGARRFLETVEDRDRIDAVLVLSNVAARRARGPLLVEWSNDASRASIGLQRTAAASLRQETGTLQDQEGAAGQLARLAFPVGVGAQGPLLDGDAEAIRFSGSGELPPAAGDGGEDDVNAGRLGDLGRAVLRALSAVDAAGTPAHGPATYVVVSRKVLPGWVISLLSLALILPALAAAIDAFARARRSREPVAPWGWWVLGGVAPFVLALAVAEVLVLTGQAPDPPPAPLAPADEPLDGAAAASLAAAAAVIAPAWFFLRREIRRRAGLSGVAARGAGSATALVLALAAVALWVANPYAALLMLPAVHLWTLAVLGEPPTRRGAAALLVAGGLVAPAGVAVFYLARLSLDPLEGAWYLFLLVTGHHVGLFTALLGCVLLGALGSVVAIVRARGWERPAAAERSSETVRHAGRGALGGTLSALRR